MRRIGAGCTVVLLIAWNLLGCAVHPITLEKQFMIISEEKEIAIGKRSDPVILQQFGYYDDPALQEYVNEIGQKLAAVCSRKDITYYFKVVDSEDINAFALPGGWIYVTRGILAMMNSEAELAGVLGHEIGHVVGRDSANMISQQTWFQIVALAGMAASPTTRELAMAGNMLFDAMMLGYGREKEFLADSQGVNYMFMAGYDPLQMVALQESLGRLYQGPVGYARYLTTHPYVGDRINRARAEAKVLYAMDNVFTPQDGASGSTDGKTVKPPRKLIRADEYKMHLDGLAYGPPDNIRRIKIYTVGEDDTLATIAGAAGDDSERLKEIALLNGLETGAPLYTGQKLKVVY
jgi:predicted Zn-dependent protease